MKIRQIELSIVDNTPVGLSNQERIYLRRAWHIARASTERQRHGAIIVQGRKTLAIGCNTFRNSPANVLYPARQSSWHAEVNALKQTTRQTADGSRIFVVRINPDGKLMHSAPCEPCQMLAEDYGVKEIIHS